MCLQMLSGKTLLFQVGEILTTSGVGRGRIMIRPYSNLLRNSSHPLIFTNPANISTSFLMS